MSYFSYVESNWKSVSKFLNFTVGCHMLALSVWSYKDGVNLHAEVG